jgi:protein involved in polysaccharide export with SLBB domain
MKYTQNLSLILALSLSNLLSVQIHAQAANPLSDAFLAGLPPSVAEELQLNNAVQQEEDLEKLFRADTEFLKTKDILERIRYELKAVDKRLLAADGKSRGELERFGESFFSTIQSSYMAVNVPASTERYILDVGDELSIMLTGGQNISSSKADPQLIQRDGTILLPSIGKLKIAGMTMQEADQAIKTYLAKTSKGTAAFMSLSKIRDIEVLLLGGVISPGIFTLSGGSNILTALNVSGGISDKGSYRKIEHKRDGKIIQTIDLYDIFVFGDINFQIPLRSGDVLFINPAQYNVPVTGGVNNEAIFEALPDETVADLIKYAGGFSASFSGYSSVFVKRSDLTNHEIIDLSVQDLETFKIQPRDILLVPSFASNTEPVKKVTIEGLVQKPGEYYVTDDENLSSLIKRAGGYKKNAYEFGAGLFRENAINIEKQYSQQTYFDTIRFVISNIAQPGMSINSDTAKLLAEELRAGVHSGRVVTEFNLNQLAKHPSQDIVLQHNDRIVIPQIQKVIYLFGDFKQPSNVSYDPNLSLKDYIKMAGGTNKSAQKELIVIDPSGISQSYKLGLFASNKVQLYPGSIVYAPRDIAKLDGVRYAASVSPILSSLALSLASLNSINN